MDTKEDILVALYTNLINMVNAFTMMHLPIFKYTLAFLYEIIASKKGMRNILLLQTNYKYKVVKRKPVVGNDSGSSRPGVFC